MGLIADTLPFRAVLMRELRTLLRTHLGFGLAIGVIAFIGVLFMLSWKSLGQSVLLNARAMVGRSLFITLSILQIGSCCLVAATLGAASFTGERQRRTLDLLLTTGLSGRTLTLAKWWSAVIFMLLIFIASLPLHALVLQLGGVGANDWLVMAAGGVCLIATAGIYGLAFSSASRSTLRAVLGMVGSSLILFFFSMFFLPLLMVGVALLTGGSFSLTPLIGLVLYGALIIWLSYKACMSKLRSLRSDRELLPGDTAMTDPTPPPVEDLMRIPRPFKDGLSPVYQQERRFHGYGLQFTRVILSMGAVCVLLGTFFTWGKPASDVGRLFTMLSLAYVQVTAPTICASALARERELGTLPLLMATPLSPWQIVRGKYMACLFEILCFWGIGVLISGWFVIPGILTEPLRVVAELGHLILATTTYAGFAVALCLTISLFSTSVGQAMVLCFLAMLLGATVPSLVLSAIGYHWQESSLLQNLIVLSSPYYYLRNWSTADFDWSMHVLCLVELALGAAGLLRLATSSLERRRGQGQLA